MDIKIAYLVGNTILLIIWLLLFFRRKDLRRQQLVISILSAPLAPIAQYFWFYFDYWRPQYFFEFFIKNIPLGIEESIFAFLVGGIGAVIYESIFHKNYRKDFGKNRHILTILIIFVSIVFFLFLKTAGINSIWASILSLIFISFFIAVADRLLIKEIIFSSALMLLVGVVVYTVWLNFFPEVVNEFWLPEGLSGIMALGIPIEELLWFFAWGGFAGVIYEFWMNKNHTS